MKHDILIRTDAGPVVITPTGPETFDLRGKPLAIEKLKQALPALEAVGNPTGMLGDCLTRLVYLAARENAEASAREGKLTSHEEMQRMTFTENPLVMFQTRVAEDFRETLTNLIAESHDEAAVNSARLILEELPEQIWTTDRVFLDPAEAQAFVDSQPHRYASDDEDRTWRFYTGIAAGRLAAIVKDARDIENA